MTKFSTKNADEIGMLLNYPLNPVTSPWRQVLKDFELMCEGPYPVLIIKDTKFDPTILVSLLLNLRVYSDYDGRFFGASFTKTLNQNPDLNQVLVYILVQLRSSYPPLVLEHNSYFRNRDWCPHKMLAADGNLLAGGDWYDEKCYNRPFLQSVFSPGVTKEAFPDAYDGKMGFDGAFVPEAQSRIYQTVRRTTTLAAEGKFLSLLPDAYEKVIGPVPIFGSVSANSLLSSIIEAHKEITDAILDRG